MTATRRKSDEQQRATTGCYWPSARLVKNKERMLTVSRRVDNYY
jgi:hypothetical protein